MKKLKNSVNGDTEAKVIAAKTKNTVAQDDGKSSVNPVIVPPMSKEKACKIIQGAIQQYAKNEIVNFDEPDFDVNPKKPEIGYMTIWFPNRSEVFTNRRDGKNYVTVASEDNMILTLPLDSKMFVDYIVDDFYNLTGGICLSPDRITKYVSRYRGALKKNKNLKSVNSRIGMIDDNELAYNLANDKNEFVVVKPGSVKICHSSMIPTDHPFFTTGVMKEQVKPAVGQALKSLMDLLRPYFPLKDPGQLIMLVITLIAWFIPNIPKPIILLTGEPGSGKSTCAKWIQEIVDPTMHANFVISKDIERMKPIFANHYVTLLDNVSKLSDDQSDFLATAVTRSSAGGRKLYTDDQLSITNFEYSAIVLAGVSNFVFREDLMTRIVHFPVEKPSKENAKSIEELEFMFKNDKPLILQQIFLALSEVFITKQKYDELLKNGKKPKIPPFTGRLYDYEVFGFLISNALFGSPRVFYNLYSKMYDRQLKELLLRDVTVNATYCFLENLELDAGDTYSHTPTGFFNAVKAYAEKTGLISSPLDTTFAQTAAIFGKTVSGSTEPNPTLLKLGFKIISKSGTQRKIIAEKL